MGMLVALQGCSKYFQSSLDQNTIAQLQHLQRLLHRQGDGSTKPEAGAQVHFDRKLLDFDYGSDEEDDPTNSSPKIQNSQTIDTVGSLLSNPEVLRQLQTLQASMSNQNNAHGEFDMEKLRKLQEMKQQEEEFDKHLAQTLPNLPFAAECEFKPNTNSPSLFNNFFLPTDMSQPPPGYKPTIQTKEDNAHESEVEFVGTNDDMEVIDIDHGDSRSPSRERYGRRRRSRSRDRSRDRDRDRDRNRRRRSRSRSRSRNRKHRSRSRERDREREKEKEKEREKERERRKRGLPPIKKDNLSVCSTTLWVGHLSKLVHQEDLSDTFGEFGEIISIDLIIPRGCAFIVMDRRQDAARCLTKLKNHKLQGKAITLAWAPGKGVKGKDLKDYWEGDLGVSYIPFAKLRQDMDLELLEDGGMIDEDSAPDWMKAKIAAMSSNSLNKEGGVDNKVIPAPFITMPEASSGSVDTSQPPPVPNAGLLPPPPMQLPMVSPFQLNNRLLGMPPGMMPNVPMGVPPPNLPGALLTNSLLGMGGQFPPGLLAPPLAPQLAQGGNMDNKNAQDVGGPPRNLPEAMMPFSLIPPHPPPMSLQTSHHDDNMDVEMEDAEKPDKHMEASLHMMGGMPGNINSYNGDGNLMGRRDHPGLGRDGRDDDMPRGRNRRDSRERDHGDRRDRDRDNGRDRGQRWGRDSRPESRDERRDREKALNDRLRQMAGDSSFRDEPEPPPPSLLDRAMFPGYNGEGPMDLERFRRRPDDYPVGPDGLSPPRYPDYDNSFEGPPLEYGPPIDFEGPALEYEALREYDDRYPPMRGDRFDDRRRGDFFPPRDFGMRGPPRFRSPVAGMDMFGPRGGPPLMRPHMFRGGRGPRGGPMWMDRPPFDGPPDFYRGPPNFDDGSPHRPRHDRGDRRRFGRHDDIDDEPVREGGRDEPSIPNAPGGGSGGSGRRTNRWSNGSPVRDPQPTEPPASNVDDMVESTPASRSDDVEHQPEVMHQHEPDDHTTMKEEPKVTGNTTPLHDEPAEQQRAPASQENQSNQDDLTQEQATTQQDET
ncbi:SR-related and CTD-associated factor 4 isoform X2 [Atheta coriaria]|uniref:SR-related and CTD-associated factor 4 isoform X2 n=1 Tax=Dalotia coriaria TaxID=877792 RepID=UPI0031F43AA7